MLLNKHSEKMTDTEREKAQEQLKALHQAYSDVSQHCSDQTPPADEGFKSIDDIGGIGNGTVDSVMSGQICQMTEVSLPEAQPSRSSNLLQPELHGLDLDDALRHDFTHTSSLSQFHEQNKASQCIESSDVSSVLLSEISAASRGARSEDLVIKMIKLEQMSDGLKVCYTGDALTLEETFQSGLIPASVYVKILERQKNWQDVVNHSAVQKAESSEINGLLLKCLNRNLSLTPGREISRMSVPKTGENVIVDEALVEDFTDQDPQSTFQSPESQICCGAKLHKGAKLVVDEAVQCDLVSCSSTLIVLGNQQWRFLGLVLPHGQEEEGGILNVTSGTHYDLEAALSKRLVDEETALDLLDEKRSVLAHDEDIRPVLKHLLSNGFLSSNLALNIMEQQSLLVGVNDPKSDCSISISEAFQSGVASDECVDKILNSDPEASFYPEEKCNHGSHYDEMLGLLDINEAENSEPAQRKAVMMLDLSSTEIENRGVILENGGEVVDWTGGDVEEMTNYLHPSILTHSGNRHAYTQVTSSISMIQVTDKFIHPADRTSAPTKAWDSQVSINNQLTDQADMIQNAAQSPKSSSSSSSYSSSLNDGMPDNNTPPENQTPTSADQFCNDDSLVVHDDFLRGRYYAQVENQSVTHSSLDMSSSHSDVLFEETRNENDVSGIESPLVSEPTQSADYSSAWDLVENTFISVSVADGYYDQHITEDCSEVKLPQQTVLQSQGDFTLETESRSYKKGQSQNAVPTNEIAASYSIKNIILPEHYIPTTTTVSPEPTLTDNFPASKHGAADDVDSSCCSILPSASDKNPGQPEAWLDILPETNVCASIKSLQADADFLLPTCITADVASSAQSVLSNTVWMDLNDQGKTSIEGTDVRDLQNVDNENSKSAITEDQNAPQASDRDRFDDPDTSDSLSENRLRDSLSQDILSFNKTETVKQALMLQEEKVQDQTEMLDVPNIQLQLLQVLKSLSSKQDPAVLQDMMDTLSSTTLVVDSQEDQRHTLEDIKEESSEEQNDRSTEDDTNLCHSPAASQQPSSQVSDESDVSNPEEVNATLFSIQDYLESVGRLQDHADVLDDVRTDFLIQPPMSNNMEELQVQIEECQSLKSHLSRLAGVLSADLEKAEQLLNSVNEDIPIQIHQDLASIYLELQSNFNAVFQSCTERSNSLIEAIETVKIDLESSYQKHLSDLDELAAFIQNNSEVLDNDFLNTCDLDALKYLIQQNKDMENNLQKVARLRLEDVGFDVQCFISENTQFLNPAQTKRLLKLLNVTHRAFRDLTERLVDQRCTLDTLLATRERESQQKSILERHKEFSDKMEEVCDDLTLAENRLIGHQQQAENAECVRDLQQYQQEHQVLQKEILATASALNEIISSTEKFLEENRSKLTPDQIAVIETKLEETKSKANLINQRADESRKDLEKVVTTAIKQESEKAAAVEKLEESKNKIEGLLDWISNIGNENKNGPEQTGHISKENGNLPEETSVTGLIEEDDNGNGNALQTTEKDSGRESSGKDSSFLDLDKQYDRIKARHQEILSQQQDLIVATQSAQALLDKQANMLSAGEKEKLQKDIQELKALYETSLTQNEQQMKLVQCVQEELKKFQDDCEEFEGWLDQAEGEIEELEAPAGCLSVLSEKLQHQKSFSEDVISHKGDLRFITISGQKVLDVAKACGWADAEAKNTLLQVDTSGTCAAVKDKLDSAASRYKTLHSQCNHLGNNLKDVVDKYKKYEDSSAALLKWLSSSEEEARRQQSEPIAADPQTLQKQLEETKALQTQMTGQQTAIDSLCKTAESLITSEGNMLSNPDEIQETVDDIVERYDNLSKSVSDRNEKQQITLTRSMSVQDGLDEMMSWMEGVEASMNKKGHIPLDSASIGDILSKELALEQDIASRQSSISAIKSKVKKFVETADPSSAALLQSKMDVLSQRFTDACHKHKQQLSNLEQLKEKVEQFEKTAAKVQQFVVKRSQDLHEIDGPGKTFNELSQLMQDTKAEMAAYASDLEKLQTLSKELSDLNPDGNKAHIQSKMDNLSNVFNTFKDTVREKEEEVSSCQDQLGEFRSAAAALSTWLQETTEKIPTLQPNGNEKRLEKDLQNITGLLEEWTSKGPAVQDLNSKGSELCSVMSFLTSPAKTKTPNKSALTNGGGPASHAYLTSKELMVIQQNMSFVNEGYVSLGEMLKSRAADLSRLVQEMKDAQKGTDLMMTWLKDMKKTAASWNDAATEKDAMKTQLEQQKVFEDDMKEKQEQLKTLREKLLCLIKTHPNSPEAEKWKEMLEQIDAAWADISGCVEERKQHLEQSNKNLDIFQSTEPQLKQWLSEKELMMSVLGPLSVDPNMLKMQKQQVQILQHEFKSRKPQYEQLEDAASAILNSSGKLNPSCEKLVREQLTALTQKWQGLTGQLDQRDGLIDQAVVKTGQFQDLLRRLSQTAAQLENQLVNQQGYSTQPDAVKKQLEDAQTVSAQLREERKKLKEAEAIKAELTAMVTEDYLKADLDRQLESVSKPFKQLEEKAAKRIQQLNSTFASSQQFHQTSKDFQSWLDEKLQKQSKPQLISANVDVLQQTLEEHDTLQKALEEHEGTYNTITAEGEMLLQSTDVESSITQVKALQKDVDKHQGMMEQLNTAADSLLEAANADTEAIKEERASIVRRVDNVTEDLQSKRESLERISCTLREFNDAYREAKCQLEGAKKQVVAYESLGVQGYSNKNLTNMKAQHKILEGVQNHVEHLKNLAKNLVVDVPEADGVTDLLLQADSIEKHYSSLNNKVEDTCATLESKLQGIGQFQNSIREMFAHFTDLDDELDNMAPVDLDLIILKEQQDSIQNFVAKLQELLANTANAGDSCKKMLETEASPDLLGLKRDLDALSKQCGKLLDRAKGREVQVQRTLAKLEELYCKLHQLTDKLRRAADKEASQEAVAMETDIINQQLEAFKV
ncbi:hypothetical protein LDENG_00080090 [Lucifuga dentata]|nr:hypothetical protein LDENG_00080090 [Lucifuga dentata]